MSIKKIKELMQSRSNEPTNIHSNSKYANHGAAASQLNQLMSKHGFEHNLWCTKLQLEQYELTALNQVAFEITLPLNKTYLFNIGQTNIAERIKEYDEKIAIREAKKEVCKVPKEAKYVQEYEEKIKQLEDQIHERDDTINHLTYALNHLMNSENQRKVA